MKFEVDISNTFGDTLQTKMWDGRPDWWKDGRRLLPYPPPPFRRGITRVYISAMHLLRAFMFMRLGLSRIGHWAICCLPVIGPEYWCSSQEAEPREISISCKNLFLNRCKINMFKLKTVIWSLSCLLSKQQPFCLIRLQSSKTWLLLWEGVLQEIAPSLMMHSFPVLTL